MTRRRVTPVPVLAVSTGAALVLGLSAPAGAADPVEYVALGDSFSAGTGTRASTDDCYRSPYGYPALLAQSQGLALDYQACSGAATDDVHAHQLGTLSASTDYVTMTIGGNDLGYASVVTSCALPGWLANCGKKVNEARTVLYGQMPQRYDDLFAEIGALAPNADVVIGSYPHLFNGTDCNAGTFFSSAEMTDLNRATDELATVIAQRTAAAGFTYVDARPSFTGHAVCDSTEWVNGLSWPIQESYHPNRAGNVGYAEVFWPGSTAATTTRTTATADAPSLTARQQVRAEADAVLAMGLDSRANLSRARSAGVPSAEVARLVADLRSSDAAVVARALEGLARLDARHEARVAARG